MLTAVIDTNLLVYAAVQDPLRGTVSQQVLDRCDRVAAPDSVFAEATSAVAKLLPGGVSVSECVSFLDDLFLSVTFTVPAHHLWRRALEHHAATGHSTYDTLFVALAESENCSLVTFDRSLRARFPQICLAPAAFLAAHP